ncbi:MAG: choline/ethanolamine kinase family protein, partial [Ginsengibacter sp.]
DSRLNAFIARMPALSNVTSISLLDGGLTNKNYRIDTETGSFVMRVSDGKPNMLGINRENEKINTHRAYVAGVGPAVIDSFAKEGVLLINWINAKTLDAADMHNNPGLLKRMSASLQLLHAGPAFQGNFHFPSMRKNYLNTVLENNFFMPEQYMDTAPLVEALEDAVAINPEPLVPCNNDLLAENFLDDGNKIWIIDYEYSGQNEASFEIGNLASESGLSAKDVTALCNSYWQADLPAKVARALAWSMIARFGWVLWASIQEAVSKIDFDFRTWGMKKWNSLLPELKSDNYHTILKTIKQEHL